jgi:hypothetical protein
MNLGESALRHRVSRNPGGDFTSGVLMSEERIDKLTRYFNGHIR